MASPDNYVPIIPPGYTATVRLKDFMERFYAISDDQSQNEEWVDCFLPNAVVIIGDRSAKGTEEIRRLRLGMWEKTESRRHRVGKVFPATFGGADELEGITIEYNIPRKEKILTPDAAVLQGSVDFVTKNGEQKAVSWAGHAVLHEVQGILKYQFYQVYLSG